MAVSTMFDSGKKYTVWYYGLSRSPGNNLQVNMRGSKCDEYYIFL